MRQPTWNLPPGVSPGTRESFQRADWAGDEEEWLKKTPLIALDQAFVQEMLPPPSSSNVRRIVDLGCGAGRASLALARRGYEVLAVDLSASMLAQVQSQAQAESLPMECLEANLVHLAAIPTGSCAHAICLFSTLGMIRGAEHRRAAAAEFYRILAPGGLLLLHAHQLWWNLRQYGGAAWMARHLVESIVLGRVELGDRFATYRGVPNFYLHSFRRQELRRLLLGVGFRIEALRPITGDGAGYLRASWLLPAWRSGGWLMACRKA